MIARASRNYHDDGDEALDWVTDYSTRRRGRDQTELLRERREDYE